MPQQRYKCSVISHASERPKHVYEYYVTGRGQFPFDMLRYDACWPANTEDAMNIARAAEIGAPQLSIKMRSYREPTIGRWDSFVWSVGLDKL